MSDDVKIESDSNLNDTYNTNEEEDEQDEEQEKSDDEGDVYPEDDDEEKTETVTTKKMTFNRMRLYDSINPQLQDSYFKVIINDKVRFIHKQNA